MLTANPAMTRWRIIGMVYVVSLLFLLFQGGKTALMLFCIFNVLLVYLVLGRWSGIGSVAGERRLLGANGAPLEQSLTAGACVNVRVSVEIPGVWPIPYVLVRDKLIRQDGEPIPFEASFVPSYRHNGEVVYTTPPLERGVYRFASTECTTRDIFGLFEHSGTFESPAPFSVYPRTVAIREWQLAKRGAKGAYSTSASRHSAKETTQINGVREYIYGDKLSRIHWNATAKTGQWKSKEFERESLPRTVLMLDRYEGAYERAEQFELAVSVAASLMDFGFRRSTAMGLLSVGQSTEGFAPQPTTAQRQLVMNHLVRVRADGAAPLYRALRQGETLLPQGSIVVLVTPQTGEETIKAMEWLSRRGAVPVLIHLKGITAYSAGGGIEHGASEWLHLLKKGGFAVHPIKALQELPDALEGGSVW